MLVPVASHRSLPLLRAGVYAEPSRHRAASRTARTSIVSARWITRVVSSLAVLMLLAVLAACDGTAPTALEPSDASIQEQRGQKTVPERPNHKATSGVVAARAS
jgi:predicted small lipoprotein YifL